MTEDSAANTRRKRFLSMKVRSWTSVDARPAPGQSPVNARQTLSETIESATPMPHVHARSGGAARARAAALEAAGDDRLLRREQGRAAAPGAG
ncbi:hypothetical protein WME91_42915 [Sorangium sp. So ce269]